MLSTLEKKVLLKVADSQIITKEELRNFLKKDRSESDVSGTIDMVTRKLMDKKLVAQIAPIGSTCFVITQHGNRFLNNGD